MREGLGELHGAEVGEEAELLANAQQRRALGPLLFRNRRVAVGQADGAEEDGVGQFAQRQRGVRQRLARGVDARPAHGRRGDGEVQVEFLLDRAEDFERLAHDLRSDAIARQRRNFQQLRFHKGRDSMNITGAIQRETGARPVNNAAGILRFPRRKHGP